MHPPFLIAGTGIFFCISGVYFFYKNSFEPGRSVKGPLLIILMGIILIVIADVGFLNLHRTKF